MIVEIGIANFPKVDTDFIFYIVNTAECQQRCRLNLKEMEMGRNSNDDRSDSMNPNNDAYWDSLDNHSDQLNPNNDEYQGDQQNDD